MEDPKMEVADNHTLTKDPYYGLSPLCQHSLWDSSHGLEFPVSEVGYCVERTLLVWVPCGILWLGIPFYLFLLKRKRTRDTIPWTPLTYSKVVVSLIVLLSSAAELVWALMQDVAHVPLATILAPVTFIATYALQLYLVYLSRCYGDRNSSLLWVFWLVMLFCGLPQFITSIYSISNKHDMLPLALTIPYLIQYTCCIILFIVSSICDVPSKLHHFDISQRPHPFLVSSFPNQLTYWWIFPIIWQGWRRPLTQDDLWDSQPEDTVLHSTNWWQSTLSREQCASVSANHGGNCNTQKETKFKTKFERKDVSILRMAWWMIRGDLILSLILFGIANCMNFLIPQFLSLLITFITDKTQPLWQGYLYAIGLFTSSFLSCVMINKGQFIIASASVRLRSALMAAVYRKALHLSSSARRESTVGQIVNLMAVDAQEFGTAAITISNVILSPLIIIGALILLWQKVGPSVLAGVVYLVLLIPLNTYFTKIRSQLEESCMKEKDIRIKVLHEIINGIKVLKFYAWENFFVSKVETIRNKEMKLLKKAAILMGFYNFVFHVTPSMVALVTFSTYLLVSEDNVLTAEIAFVAISYFNIMRMAIVTLPEVIDEVIQARVYLKRMQKFMSLGELDPSAILHEASEDGDVVIKEGNFLWEGADDETVFQLKDIDFQLSQGQLVAVVGSVGAGKSSLISAMLGEMKKEAGKININGRVAYVSQQAWLQNATLRENVTWGQPYNEKKFQEIVKACALQEDLNILPAGDMTEIGEKGINLSGGQKQRVSLARAVYSDADVYLLDDPLSAVDAHVGRHIFNEIVGPKGLLRCKSRLLVTHAVTFLPQVDEIMVMEGGQFVEKGSYVQLLEANGNFSQYILNHITVNNQEEVQDELEELRGQLKGIRGGDALLRQLSQISSTGSGASDGRGVQTDHSRELLPQENSCEDHPTHKLEEEKAASLELSGQNKTAVAENDVNLEMQPLLTNHSLANGISIPSSDQPCGDSSLTDQKTGTSVRSSVKSLINGGLKEGVDCRSQQPKGNKQVEEEKPATGKVDREHFLTYCKAMGLHYLVSSVLLILLSQACNAGGTVWLSMWSSKSNVPTADAMSPSGEQVNFNATNSYLNSSVYKTNVYDSLYVDSDGFIKNQSDFLMGYSLFNVAQAILMFFGSMLLSICCLFAANRLHKSLLDTVIRLPMTFFDMNPSGRIINRFSKDVHTLDINLPDNMRGIVIHVVQIIVTMILIASVMPLALSFIIPTMAVYYCIQKLYVPTSRQVRRIISVSRSPVYSHFSETIQGISTIRAYQKQEDFFLESVRRLEAVQKALFTNISCNRWLGTQLETLGNILVFAAAILAVAGRDSFSPGIVGLILTSAVSVTRTLNVLIFLCALLEANIVSVERIDDYAKREREADWSIESKRPASSWPAEGQVTFSNYQTRYRSELDLVLKDVTCTIKPAEKIGIVGRTGAGKSSLTLALFRLIEPTGGYITIDNINISNIGLHDLRSKISIIPQDPVLFSGTLRQNLDPSGVHSDAEIWQALDCAHLGNYIKAQTLGLQHTVGEEGSNFSVGQRQLVCLARALLRQSRILVLDEATAAVDLETDDLLQATIREQFQHCTVLTIAHRLITIMDADRVLVLDQGNVAEFDSPSALLVKENSIFYGMAKDAGVIESK